MRKAFYTIGVILFFITNTISLLVFASLFKQQGEIDKLRRMTEETREKVEKSLEVSTVSSQSAKFILTKEEEENPYILKLVDDHVQVYHQDGQTLYEKTDILYSHLPPAIQKELSEGKTVYTLEELYGFLETYSS